MKKGLIIALAAVVALVLVAGVIVIVNSIAPNVSIEGTYTAEDGSTATISADKLEFSTGEAYSISKVGFSLEYLGSFGEYQYVICELSEEGSDAVADTLGIHYENGTLFFGFNDLQYNLD